MKIAVKFKTSIEITKTSQRTSSGEQVSILYQKKNNIKNNYQRIFYWSGWNLFKVNKNIRKRSMTFFLCLYCWPWSAFTNCSGVFIIDYEQVNAGWVGVLNVLVVILFVNFENIYHRKLLLILLTYKMHLD